MATPEEGGKMKKEEEEEWILDLDINLGCQRVPVQESKTALVFLRWAGDAHDDSVTILREKLSHTFFEQVQNLSNRTVLQELVWKK